MSEIEHLADWMRHSHYITLFTGAGMSTESGAIHDISSLAKRSRDERRSLATRVRLLPYFYRLTEKLGIRPQIP